MELMLILSRTITSRPLRFRNKAMPHVAENVTPLDKQTNIFRRTVGSWQVERLVMESK